MDVLIKFHLHSKTWIYIYIFLVETISEIDLPYTMHIIDNIRFLIAFQLARVIAYAAFIIILTLLISRFLSHL